MKYFLGIDVSTTGSKALLVDERGEVAAVASSAHTRCRHASRSGPNKIRMSRGKLFQLAPGRFWKRQA